MVRRSTPDDTLEREALSRLAPGAVVCGVDEVGRGPWAGPLAAGAAVLDLSAVPSGLYDSKRMTAKAREAAAAALSKAAETAVGWASVAEIEALGVTAAVALAMTRAVAGLPRAPSLALVDGPRAPALPCPAIPVLRGDGRSLSIAAAAIVAKVARDRRMAELAAECPGYGWSRNMGYGTAEHAAALRRLGATAHHRRRFRPIHNILCGRDLKDAL
jgi:ribonuclease HII